MHFREDSEGPPKEIPHCSLKSAYQQYGQPPGQTSIRAVCAMTRRECIRRAIKPVTGRLWQSRLALTLFGLIMRHKALASMMRLGCPGVENSRDPRKLPVKVLPDLAHIVPFFYRGASCKYDRTQRTREWIKGKQLYESKR